MKLRLLEYLACPEHPDDFLQLRRGHVAKLFELGIEVGSPLCRYYCGLGQGRLEDLPEGFVPDCQSCISMDIQWGVLTCPVCGGFYGLYEGVPIISKFFPRGTDPAADRLAAEYNFGASRSMEYRRRGPFASFADRFEANFLAENIDLESINSVLFLGAASGMVLDALCNICIEVVVASEEPHELLRRRDSELLNPSRLEFYLVTGTDLAGIRDDSFDLVVAGYRLYGPRGFIAPPVADLARVTRKGGTVAMMLYRDNLYKRLFRLCEGECVGRGEGANALNDFLEQLASEMSGMEIKHVVSNIYDLVLLTHRQEDAADIVTAFHGDDAEAMINA